MAMSPAQYNQAMSGKTGATAGGFLGSIGATAQNQGTNYGPYAGNLQTNFNSAWDTGQGGTYNYYGNSNDSDVAGAQQMTNELGNHAHGADPGVNAATDSAMLNMYLGRIGEKNALGQQISNNAGQRQGALSNINQASNMALQQGVKNTNQNFNSRGLLYSGMNQAGQQQVRGQVAGQAASDVAGTNQDFANSLAQAKSAYASVDLQNAQQNIDMANQAYSTASQNNIARLQAYQQLGSGLGSAAGGVVGSMYAPSPNNPSGTTVSGSATGVQQIPTWSDNGSQGQGLVA